MANTEYEYRDKSGILRYTVVRNGDGPGKTFEIFDPEGDPLPDPIPAPKRILYRLPELLSSSPCDTVFICEGEKDTDRLREHGQVATTMPCGTRAGWSPKYTKYLSNRHVVIFPDNDGPGKLHASKVLATIRKTCASAMILPLNGSSGLDDASTWFDRHSNPGETLIQRVRKERYKLAGMEDRSVPIKLKCLRLIRLAPLKSLQKLILLMLTESLMSHLPDWKYKIVKDLTRDCGAHRVTCQNSLMQLQRIGIIPPGVPESLIEIRWDLLAAMAGARIDGLALASEATSP